MACPFFPRTDEGKSFKSNAISTLLNHLILSYNMKFDTQYMSTENSGATLVFYLTPTHGDAENFGFFGNERRINGDLGAGLHIMQKRKRGGKPLGVV